MSEEDFPSVDPMSEPDAPAEEPAETTEAAPEPAAPAPPEEPAVDEAPAEAEPQAEGKLVAFDQRLLSPFRPTAEPEPAVDDPVRDALVAFEESHATYRDVTVNGVGSRERLPHDCPLCVQARAALGQ